jgi:flavin reductase (DIM6/NTAB) family NADH-FMN oxidoreductase RutF
MKTKQMNQYCSRTIQPSILYYGRPVLLLTTRNRDGTSNISPLSSLWALGDVIVLGLGTNGKAWENLVIHPECVINLPDASLWKQVERLAPLTGKNPVPPSKQKMGFHKFSAAGLTEIPSELVSPGRIAECPLQIEAKVVHTRTYPPMMPPSPSWKQKPFMFTHMKESS